jgi:hypothetical protein
MNSINRMEDVLLGLLHDRPRRLVAVIGIEAGAQALLVLELFWLLQALDLAAPQSYAFVIEGSTKIIGVLFLFIPLQVGVAEGAYALILDAMGPPAAAGAFACRRIRTQRLPVSDCRADAVDASGRSADLSGARWSDNISARYGMARVITGAR